MTASTVTLTPGAHHVPGVGAIAEPVHHPGHTIPGQVLNRTSQGDIRTWLSHIRPAAGCTRPVRLTGQLLTVERDTGQVLDVRDTETMPDGQIYTPCGNRRATVCPSCAETYRADTYHLIRVGLAGGKGVPSTVASHPAVFLTLTAPSFGTVHTRRTAKNGQVLPCRPRRKPEHCPHGQDITCNRIHKDGENLLGQPFCLDCYHHDHQVIWNHQAGELWRRTTIAINRNLTRIAKAHGVKIRLSYAKVAEFQRRGVIHFHALIRLDGKDPANPDTILPPHPHLDRAVLEDAIHHAVHTTRFTTGPHPRQPEGWQITWGEQADVRPVHIRAEGDITDTQVAAYLAKYATKATETTGHTSRRITPDTIDIYANPSTHAGRLILACWDLGDTFGRPAQGRWWTRLRRWTHMLGFGGHFSTKSRRYSVTLRFLRDARIQHARQEVRAADHTNDDTTLIVGLLSYAGSGWKSNGDAMLANTSADLARAHRHTAREELAHLACASRTPAVV